MYVIMNSQDWAYLFAVLQLVFAGTTAFVVLGLTMDYYERNRQLVLKQTRKIFFVIFKYALVPVVLFQKKYSLSFWLKLKARDC